MRRLDRTASSPPTPWRQVQDLVVNRKLLGKFAYQELMLKYRRSVGGVAWALATPLAYLAIYSIAFKVILRSYIPGYPIFIWSGLLVWNAVLYAMSSSTSSITRSWGLVTKVKFPRVVLPFSSILAAGFNLLMQAVVLIVAMGVFRWTVSPRYLILVVPALIALFVLLSGLACLTSAINVFVRDTQHLVDVVLLAWFWVSPIIYGFRSLSWSVTISRLMLLNPVTPIVLSFQRAIYSRTEGAGQPIIPEWSVGTYLLTLVWPIAVGLVLLYFGLRVFGRLQMRFADEL